MYGNYRRMRCMYQDKNSRLRGFTNRIEVLWREYKVHIILVLLALALIGAGYAYLDQYFYILRDPRAVKELVMGYEEFSVLVLIAFQILQIIFFFIPGGFVEIAGGYIYGLLWGTVIALTGTTIGSIIIFTLSRKFGKPFIERVVSEKDMKYFKRILHIGHDEPDDHRRKRVSLAVIFLLYLIPGLPKDVLGYICGITDITLRDFILYSTLARIPAMMTSVYFGSKVYSGDKTGLIVIGLVVSVIFVIGVIKGEKIIKGMTGKRKV
jgi:uncharacterized membrane protein YdjX (TVP38/TMEM64 family)